MRHQKHRHKLGVSAKRRKHLLSNLAASLILHGQMTTTIAKAKAIRPYVEKLITLGKKDDLNARRRALSYFQNKQNIVDELFKKSKNYENRAGGYLRILKLGETRLGDGAPKAIIAFV